MSVKTVDAVTLKGWIDSGEAVVVDVREPAEYAAESIACATLLPLAAISKASLPNYRGKKLVIHCRKGGRGGSACEKLLAEDPNLDIYNLEGGINSWIEAGYPIASSGGFVLPLDRQVQLTIGLTLLAGSFIGFFLTPLLFILTGMVGVGLTIAGLTGFCGLAKVIAKMPWNQKSSPKSCCAVKK